MAELTAKDLEALHTAVDLLEHPGLMARLADALGTPIEKGLSMLPEDWRQKVSQATHSALMKGLSIAVRTLGGRPADLSMSRRWHKIVATASGATSGAIGLPALAIELPVTTTVMLRSIAEIAREEGQDLEDTEARLQCLQVLAFGSPTTNKDDAVENGYWAVRLALARAVSDAAAFIAERGVVEEGAPPLVRLITSIAARFGVVVGEEAAAKAIPFIGAFGGATVNYLFMDHFQNMAKGHFTVLRLEDKYGQSFVREEYARIRAMAA